MKINNESLVSLQNIGSVMAMNLRSIGINTKEEFLNRDPYEIFRELLDKTDPTLCRSALAGIVGAHLDVPWHKVSKEAAAEFIRRYPEHKWGKH